VRSGNARFPATTLLDHGRRGVALFGAITLLSLGGCSGFSWNPLNWFDSGPRHPPVPLEPIANPIPVRTLWRASIGAADRAVFVPAVANGSIFVAGSDGSVARLDESTGEQLWRVDVGSRLSGGVGSDGVLVAVGSREGEVFALEASGQLRWKARVSSEVLAAPEVAGDIVVVRSADSRIFAFDARDGRRRWVYQRATPSLSVRTPAGTVLRAQYVFAGFPGGKLVALAQSNGGLRWEGTVSLPHGTTELERMSDVTGLPWIGEGQACAVAHQGRAACFDLANGNMLWARPVSSSAGIAVDNRYVYVSEDAGAVSALARSGGTSLWRQDKLGYRSLSAPLVEGRDIVVGDVEGYVHILSAATGAFVGRVPTDGSAIAAPPVRIANGFVVQTSKGGIYAFALR
jgi:outer membrane protein assembly factor BamB